LRERDPEGDEVLVPGSTRTTIAGIDTYEDP